MNSPQVQQTQRDTSNSFHMIRTLGGVGILCSLLIVSVYQFTKPIIEKKKAIALENAIYQVIPGATARATFAWTKDGKFSETSEPTESGKRIFAGLDDQGNLIGFAIEASGNGFQDIIHLLYGYSHEKQAIVGFQVLESKETPGLGDKINNDENFLKNFENLDVSLNPSFEINHPIELVKSGKKTNPWQIDAITGATISSTAVSKILRESTQTWVPRIQKQLQEIKDQIK